LCSFDNFVHTSSLSHLLEADVLGVLAEAATAHIKTVLADETLTSGAHTAEDIDKTSTRKMQGEVSTTQNKNDEPNPS
jgi:hypothetical protein